MEGLWHQDRTFSKADGASLMHSDLFPEGWKSNMSCQWAFFLSRCSDGGQLDSKHSVFQMLWSQFYLRGRETEQIGTMRESFNLWGVEKNPCNIISYFLNCAEDALSHLGPLQIIAWCVYSTNCPGKKYVWALSVLYAELTNMVFKSASMTYISQGHHGFWSPLRTWKNRHQKLTGMFLTLLSSSSK